MTSPNYPPFSLRLFFIARLPLNPPPHLPEQSRAMQQYYQRHMVQNQNPSQESPGLFSYASSPFLAQTEALQLQDESRPNCH